MQRSELVVMPPVRRPGRSLAEPSIAKASKVRTTLQHDWSIQASPNQFHNLSDAKEYVLRPREAPRTKHRDAEVVGSTGVARRSSRTGASSRDSHSHSKDAKAVSASARPRTIALYQDASPSLSRAVDEKRPRHGRKRLSSPSTDNQLQALGAWTDTSLVRHKGVPAEFLEDNGRYFAAPPAAPKSPRYLRLPSPELLPMSDGHEFCACCVHEVDELDEAWYKAGRAKMDAQLEDAMAHIATMSAGGRRRLEF